MAEVCGRERKLIVAYVCVLCRAVFTLTCVTSVDCLCGMLVGIESVKESICGVEYEIKIREKSKALLLCVFGELLKIHLLGYRALPLEIVRYGRTCKTAVGKALHNEVYVCDRVVAKILEVSVHSLYVLKGRQRRHYVDRDRKEFFRGLQSSEYLNVKRNIIAYVLGCKSCKYLEILLKIVAVCKSHTNVRRLIVSLGNSALSYRLSVSLLGDLVLGKHYVTHLVAARVLSCRNDRPLGVRTDRDSICDVIRVGRSGVHRKSYGVVLTRNAAVRGGKLDKRVTLFNDRYKSAILCVFNGSLVSVSVGLGLCEIFLLINTVNGITDNLLIHTGYLMVSVILTVNLTRDKLTCSENCDLLEIKERSRTVGEEGVTLVGVHTCSHVREYLDIVETVERLVETDTVCGKSYNKSRVLNGVLKSHLEQRIVLCFSLILYVSMILFHVLEGVFLAVLLDKSLLLLDGLLTHVCLVEHVDRKALIGGICRCKLLELLKDGIVLAVLVMHFLVYRIVKTVS